MDKKMAMVILSLFLFLGAVHALTLVPPINMTAIPFNSKYYNALINGQVYAGNYSANRTQAGAATAVQFPNVSFIGYSTPVTPAISSNSADGLEFNPYVKETVTFTDSDPAIGTITVPEFCAANGDLVEFFDSQRTDGLIPTPGGSPIYFNNLPSFLAFSTMSCPAGTTCQDGACRHSLLSGFPVNYTATSFSSETAQPYTMHTGVVDGDTIQDIVLATKNAGTSITYGVGVHAPMSTFVPYNNACNTPTQQATTCPSGIALGSIIAPNVAGGVDQLIEDRSEFSYLNAYALNPNSNLYAFNQANPLVVSGFPIPYSVLNNPAIYVNGGPTLRGDPILADVDPNYPGNEIIRQVDYRAYLNAGGVNNYGSDIFVFASAAPWNVIHHATIQRTVPFGGALANFPDVVGTGPAYFTDSTGNKYLALTYQGFTSINGFTSAELRLFNMTTMNTVWAVNLSGYNYNQTSNVVVGNITGNADPEIVVAADNIYANGFTLFAYSLNGTPVAGFPIVYNNATIPELALGDLDGDGYKEIVLSGNFSIRKGDGSVYGAPSNQNLPAGQFGKQVLLADVSGDGVDDVIYTNIQMPAFIFGPGYDAIYAVNAATNTLIPGFPIPEINPTGTASILRPNGITVDDLDGDGYNEIVIDRSQNPTSSTRQVEVYKTLGLSSVASWPTKNHDAQNTSFAP